MNYLISKFDCVLIFDKKIRIEKDIIYELENCKNQDFVVVGNGEFVPFVFNMTNTNKNVQTLSCGKDVYYFICPGRLMETHAVNIQNKSNKIYIEYSSKIYININDKLVFEKETNNITYSHYEEFGEYCLVFFEGDFVVVIHNEKVEFCSQYYECNKSDKEYYFLEKLFDSLNHGRVCHIKPNELETYLVYLDNEDLKLKSTFVANIFLDCVLAGNFKYCNQLLIQDLQQTDEKIITNFFPEFDDYLPIKENEMILFKKNAPQGIYKFEILNSSIQNIMIQHR